MVRQRKLSRNEIRARLLRKGLTLSSVARRAGLSESACRMALYGPNCPAGEVALGRALKLPPAYLFPDRFDQSGSRLKNIPKATPKRKEENAA